MRKLFAGFVLVLSACGPKVVYTDSDIPQLPKLGDVMWSQAQALDPQFKKIGHSTYNDGDYAAFMAAAARLKLTTAKIKESFSKGAQFNQLADTLAANADELASAATAKDSARTSAALAATKATCKGCHSKFK